MKLVVHDPKVIAVDMCVDLGRREISVAKHLLDGAQIGAVVEQMGGEGMPEGMRVTRFDPACSVRFFDAHAPTRDNGSPRAR